MKYFRNFLILCKLCFTLTISSLGSDFPIRNGTNRDEGCAIAYNSTDHEYLVVWNEFVPFGSMYIIGPVMGQRISENGTIIGSAFKIFSTGSSPSVAYNSQKNQYLVVASGNGVQGQLVNSDGSLISTAVLMMNEGTMSRILFNSVSGNYMLASATFTEITPGSGQYRIHIFTRSIKPDLIPMGDKLEVENLAYGVLTPGESRFSIAYAPIVSTETPSGRYLLAVQTLGGLFLTMLNTQGMPINVVYDPQHPGTTYRYIPFHEGNAVGGIHNVDVAYGPESGYSISGPAFLVVWGDDNNKSQNQEWTGIWGGFVDAKKLDYLTTDPVKDNTFPISAIYAHWHQYANTWNPKAVYNPISQKFMVTWRETPGTQQLNDTKVNHIRANRVFEKIPPPVNVVISSVNGNEDPYSPAIASSTINPAGLIAWEDHRNIATNDWDIYGNLYQLPLAQSISVVKPNGNEIWTAGTQQEIKWTSTGFSNPVKVEFSTDAGTTFNIIISSTDNDGSYMWTVPNIPSDKCRIRISDAADGDPSDISDQNFEITGFVKLVFNADDAGTGSLRQAILDANTHIGYDTIKFNIPGNTLHTIKLYSPLPALTDPVIIDGFSQPGSNVNTNPVEAGNNALQLIELDGTYAGTKSIGLELKAGNSLVRGLIINHFDSCGVRISGFGNNIITGNYIGNNSDGPGLKYNQLGVYIEDSPQNTIGGASPASGNIISGNGIVGILIHNLGATGNKIQGNYIGPDVTGTKAFLQYHQIYILDAPDNIIGGTINNTRNIISGGGDPNTAYDPPIAGIRIMGLKSTGNIVQGNFIGTNSSGTGTIKNTQAGITILSSSNIIGGITESARNVISGNLSTGIFIAGNMNQLLGNYIGTDLTGTKAVANGAGIAIRGKYNIIGGTEQGSGNVIAGNNYDGFVLMDSAIGNIVKGNFIGTISNGKAALGNGWSGLMISKLSKNNVIGGIQKGAGNKIHFNAQDGIKLTGEATGNLLRGNSIFSNSGLGINLVAQNEGESKVTPNDAGDSDTGPNNLQNFPSITSIEKEENAIFIKGNLSSIPNTTFQLDFYSNSADDPSGYGEGDTLIGVTEIKTDAAGKAEFYTSIGAVIPAGYFITATVTDPSGNTSEFSKAEPVIVNTPVGKNILVDLGKGVNILFDNITKAGNSKIETSLTGPPLPKDFAVIPVNSPVFYSITTSAEFSGNIKLYIQYDDKDLIHQQEAALGLKVYEESKWTDITDSLNENANMIYGTVKHLSYFAVMIPWVNESITVISPNGGEKWDVGTQQEIKWSSTSLSGKVKIEYSTDGNATHLIVTDSTENDGTYLWTIPDKPSQNCVVIISDAADGKPFDISNAVFSILATSLHNLLIVKATEDSGSGSLRNAITIANNLSGPDTIIFQIPKTDPGYDTQQGVWYIHPKSPLPYISDKKLVLNALSQSKFVNEETNPYGPEIVLSGDKAPAYSDGLFITADSVEIYGLTINRFGGQGIVINGNYKDGIHGGRISGCYVGTDYSAMEPQGNTHGIGVWNNVHNILIGPVKAMQSPGNIISGNTQSGIFLADSACSNLIGGNYIGVNRLATKTLNNYLRGIDLERKCQNNLLAGNVIGGNSEGIMFIDASENIVYMNYIGTDTTGKVKLGNQSAGVFIYNNSQENVVLKNHIKFNDNDGISISGSTALRNRITKNEISHNNGRGIRNKDGGNKELPPPVIISSSPSEVSGTAPAGQIIEIYSDDSDQGSVYLGTDTSDISGNFVFSLADTVTLLKYITATVTDTEGNTSEFSKSSIPTAVEELAGVPEDFQLSQNYPNPFNPATTISYGLPEDSFVELVLFDIAGRNIMTLLKENKIKGYHKLKLNAGSLPSGVYFYRLKAGNYIKTLKLTLIK
ncbi:MAG: NosD domain-containing protein [Bacillota bacterium]